MNDDYLWDRSGSPDPWVTQLEETLRPLEAGPGRLPSLEARPGTVPWRAWLAVAATVLVAAALSWPRPDTRAAAWRVASVEGRAYLEGRVVDGERRMATGQALRTAASGRAHLRWQGGGSITVEPDSTVRVLRGDGHGRLALDRGRIRALIWAPPARFAVDTPSARAVDLGCAYTLSVEPDGTAVVEVQTGWVAFQARGREAFIPAGMVCRTRRGTGPGLPHGAEVTAAFRESLTAYEREPGGTTLAALLATARADDVITLWHLLARTGGEQRRAVSERIAALHPLPTGVTVMLLAEGSAAAREALWDSLGYGDFRWWREWQQEWPLGTR